MSLHPQSIALQAGQLFEMCIAADVPPKMALSIFKGIISNLEKVPPPTPEPLIVCKVCLFTFEMLDEHPEMTAEEFCRVANAYVRQLVSGLEPS